MRLSYRVYEEMFDADIDVEGWATQKNRNHWVCSIVKDEARESKLVKTLIRLEELRCI